MKNIKNIIQLITAGEVANPFNFPTGVRVAWDAQALTLTITSNNKAPDDDDMRYFYSCIKTAGFHVANDELFDESPDQPNSQVGWQRRSSRPPR